MMRLLFVLVAISAPISLFVILQGITRIWELYGKVGFVIACAAFVLTCFSIALALDNRQQPSRSTTE